MWVILKRPAIIAATATLINTRLQSQALFTHLEEMNLAFYFFVVFYITPCWMVAVPRVKTHAGAFGVTQTEFGN